jgi:hypothetical protein
MPPLVEILPLGIEGCKKSFAFGQTYSKWLLHASGAAFIHRALGSRKTRALIEKAYR